MFATARSMAASVAGLGARSISSAALVRMIPIAATTRNAERTSAVSSSTKAQPAPPTATTVSPAAAATEVNASLR